MTRINISYLIALGLLGTAVASKYFALLKPPEPTPNSGDKRKTRLTNKLRCEQHPCPRTNKRSTQTPPSPTACATPKSPTSKPRTAPAAQCPPPAHPHGARKRAWTPRQPSPRSQPSPRPTAASTPRPPSTAPCASPATSSQRAGRTRSSAASG